MATKISASPYPNRETCVADYFTSERAQLHDDESTRTTRCPRTRAGHTVKPFTRRESLVSHRPTSQALRELEYDGNEYAALPVNLSVIALGDNSTVAASAETAPSAFEVPTVPP